MPDLECYEHDSLSEALRLRILSESDWPSHPMLLRCRDVRERLAFGVDRAIELIGSGSLPLMSLRILRDQAPVPLSEYSKPDNGQPGARAAADPERVRSFHRDGATLNLIRLEEADEQVASFMRDLQLLLPHLLWVNAYLGPPGSSAFARHTDPTHALIVQVAGAKHWQIWPASDPTDPADGVDAADDPPEWETELTAGTVLYLPRGLPHVARSAGTETIHLTIGIAPLTLRWVLNDLVDAVEREVTDNELSMRYTAAEVRSKIGGILQQVQRSFLAPDALDRLRGYLADLQSISMATTPRVQQGMASGIGPGRRGPGTVAVGPHRRRP